MKKNVFFATVFLFLTASSQAAEVSVTPQVTVNDSVHFYWTKDDYDSRPANEFTDTDGVPFTLSSGTGTDTVKMHGNKGDTYKARYGFVNFYVNATVPSRTKRTFTIVFDVGFTKASGSGQYWMTDLIKGNVDHTSDYPFNTGLNSELHDRSVIRVYDKSSKTNSITVTYEVDNRDSDAEKTNALEFVLFGGYNKIGVYTPITDHFCTVKSVKYKTEEDVPAPTVTYDYATNGGASATKTSAQFKGGQGVDLSPTATFTTWEFVGWNTNKDAQEKLDSYTMPESNTTLYAIFKKKCTLTFYTGVNKTQVINDVYIYNNRGKYTTLAIPAWSATGDTGYSAFGWTTEADKFDSSVASGGEISFDSDITLYPIYKNTVTLSYNVNGGTGSVASKQATIYANINTQVSYSESAQFTLAEGTALSRTGYTFDGWHEKSATGPKRNAGATIAITGSWTYYADWKANVYTITFEGNLDLNEEKGTEGKSQIQYTYGKGVTLDAQGWAKQGHTFLGWYDNENLTGNAVTAISAIDIGDKRLFAKYSPHGYKPWEHKDGAIPGHAFVMQRTCSGCEHREETATLHTGH